MPKTSASLLTSLKRAFVGPVFPPTENFKKRGRRRTPTHARILLLQQQHKQKIITTGILLAKNKKTLYSIPMRIIMAIFHVNNSWIPFFIFYNVFMYPNHHPCVFDFSFSMTTCYAYRNILNVIIISSDMSDNKKRMHYIRGFRSHLLCTPLHIFLFAFRFWDLKLTYIDDTTLTFFQNENPNNLQNLLFSIVSSFGQGVR